MAIIYHCHPQTNAAQPRYFAIKQKYVVGNFLPKLAGNSCLIQNRAFVLLTHAVRVGSPISVCLDCTPHDTRVSSKRVNASLYAGSVMP